VNLATPGCMSFSTIVHEFLHAFGVHHMHQDQERDNYIRVNWDNVIPDQIGSFVILNPAEYSQFGVPYDLTSVMHYHEFAFAVNPSIPTMVSLTSDPITPNPDSWSWLDIERINRAFCGKPW
jgi:Astacin (Peptidase family M12A)